MNARRPAATNGRAGRPPPPRGGSLLRSDQAGSQAQGAAGCYGPDQTWFTEGIIGVRITGDDGVHYGFVDVRLNYTPVRWGYNPVPDAPLVIPP